MNSDAPPFNPFPGLRSFTPEEDHLFFGREEQTLELLEKLGAHRFVAVVGTSGSGKSSLVRCGLLSHLLGGKMLRAGTLWQVAVTHPGAAPLSHLASALLTAGIYDAEEEDAKARLLATLSRSQIGLVEAIRQARLPENTNFLLVVDQFEEIFRYNRAGTDQREAANEFVSMLLHAARQKEVPVYIVLTMRSDFIGDCAQFEDLAEAVNRGEYLIPRMTREQFKQSIEGPIRVAGGGITPRLLQRLLNDQGDQADQLPCLQHALMRTWDHWRRTSRSHISNRQSQAHARPLDLEDYDAIGRMREALSRHADEIYEALPSGEHRTAATRLFQALTERGSDGRGIRRPTRLSRLAAIAGVDLPVARLVIEAYRAPGVTFLMPPVGSPLDDEVVIDISHESLMRIWSRLRLWVEAEAQSAAIYRRLHETARLHAQNRAGLYHDPDLQIALSWRNESAPNEVWAEQYGGGYAGSMAFLDKSRELAEREEREKEAARQRELRQARELAEAQSQRAEAQRRAARRLRAGLAVVAGMALVAVIATVVAIEQGQRAEKLRKAAVAELYVADMNRAGQAYREGNIGALDALLDRHEPQPGETDMRGPEYHFWRHASRRELDSMGSPTGNPNFQDLAVAPDQKTVATLTWPNVVGIYDVASHQLIKVLSAGPYFKGGVTARLTFSADGKTLAVWNLGRVPFPGWNLDRGAVRRWNTQTWQRKDYDLSLMTSVTNQQQLPTNGNRLVVVARVETKGHENLRIKIFDSSGTNVIDKGEQELTPGAKLDELKALFDSGVRSEFKGWSQVKDQEVINLVTSVSDYPQRIAAALTIGRETNGQPVAVSALAYSPDGSLLAAGSEGGQGAIWDRRTGQINHFAVTNEFRGASYLQELVFSTNGQSQRLVAAVGPDPTRGGAFGGGLVVLDAANPQDRRKTPTTSPAVSLDFSPDGRLLVSGHLDGEVNLWDTSSFDDPKRLFKSGGRIQNVRFSPQGRYLAVSTVEGNAIQVWQMPSRGLPADSPADPSEHNPRLIATLKGHSKAARVAFVGNENTLWSAGQDDQLNVWDPRRSGLYTEVPGSEFAVGLTYLAGGGDRGRLAWRSSQEEDTAEVVNRFRVGASPSAIQLYDVATATNLPDWKEGERFYILASSANGQFLAALGEDYKIRLWNSTNGMLIETTPEPIKPKDRNELWDLAVANDGKKVVWSDYGTHLWNPETNRFVDLPGSEAPGWGTSINFSFAFSPDSTRFAIGGVFPDSSGPFKVLIWDVGAAQLASPKSPRKIPLSPAFALAFAPKRNCLAVGTWDSTIQLLNPQTRQKIGDPLVGHAALVDYLAYCPDDGRTLVSGAHDQILRLWDVETNAHVQLTTLPELDGSEVNALVMEPEGRWMASGHVGQPARIWRLDQDRDPRRDRTLWQEKGDPASLRGEFAKAEEIAQQAVLTAPDQAGGAAWFALAALAVHQGDLKKFQQIRNEMVARYREKPYLVPAVYTAFVCSILPPISSTSDQLQISQQLAERVIANDATGWVVDVAKVALVLSKYRSGDYAEAGSQARKLANDLEHLDYARVVYIPVELALAMSQHHLGKPTEARDALAQARQKMEELNKVFPGTAEHPTSDGWDLWMFDTALLNEAEALIDGGK